jgi:cold shock CspA family protein
MRGIVKSFDKDKGFGFIIHDGMDIFVHQKDIIMRGFRVLKHGEHVMFDVTVQADGRIRATNVRPM